MNAATSPYVATALDLPAGSPGGSVELFLDLYTGPRPRIPAQAFILAPDGPVPHTPKGLELLRVGGKCSSGTRFGHYVTALQRALAVAIDTSRIDVLHLQHLTFGATPALIRALPRHPRIALVHGTDLLLAQGQRTQMRVLRETVRAAHAIVVPSGAMADHVRELAPTVDRGKIVHIPWGIPDRLIADPPPRPTRVPTDRLRLLYAGRLGVEKGVEPLVRALAIAEGVQLSVAAPRIPYERLARTLDRVDVRYLGWLPRPQLWQAFADHDALVVPSTTLEAMGLVALEAQACGLPVLYQPVPGLTETLGDTALATDFTDAARLARELTRLRTDTDLLPTLGAAGPRNAARYPLSATGIALTTLAHRLG
ncbi:glycosyltransferase family 4 protein [Embleya sp. NBC_00896]|uniref:glycosyltransferase family 4 protein n=1 Tax=Embleya sp. NBC_00896 TaxID=2975961 RepID=UPI002F918A2B|nr:glycosyltransferase family 4 protein [Embleya sp. NBC_00896]